MLEFQGIKSFCQFSKYIAPICHHVEGDIFATVLIAAYAYSTGAGACLLHLSIVPGH